MASRRKTRHTISAFTIVLVLAAIFRIALIPNPGFEADVSFWKSWGLAVLDHGAVKGLPLTNFNYPTPFAYVLAFMAWTYRLFANPYDFNSFWNNSNLLFLTISKLFPILADFGIAAVILWIGKRTKQVHFPQLPYSFYQILASIYLLNPLTLFDGALWGQVDSVGVLLFLIALCLLLTKRLFLAGVIYMVAMMTKLQNMIYGPVFFLFIWQLYGLPGVTRAIAGSAVTFVGLNIEFILARQMWRVFESIVGNYDYFPWMSLNAYNIWWVASGAAGMKMSDKVAAIGIINAKTVGLYLFSATYLFACLFMLVRKVKDKLADPQKLLFGFLTGLIIAASGFFLFQTESHDRYAFPISIFLLLWIPLYIAQHYPKLPEKILETPLVKQLFFFYGLFTIVYFYNLHNAMIINYPANGIPILNGLNIPALTIIVSFIQLGFFFLFLAGVRDRLRPIMYILPIGFVLFAITAKNMPLLLKKPISITTITPMESKQGYGGRQVDMPTVAGFGFDKWGFLSVQYSFYRHGVGTHAPSREIYDINRKFTKFTTDYGIDTNAGPQGSVVFEVYGDGKLLFASDKIGRYELPRHADIDVTGVKILELVTTDAGDGMTDDHADWLNPLLHP